MPGHYWLKLHLYPIALTTRFNPNNKRSQISPKLIQCQATEIRGRGVQFGESVFEMLDRAVPDSSLNLMMGGGGLD